MASIDSYIDEPFWVDAPQEDVEFEDFLIKDVERRHDPYGIYVTTESLTLIWVSGVSYVVPGDKIRTYGASGQEIRGVSINGRVVYYRTSEMQEIKNKYAEALAVAKERREMSRKIPGVSWGYFPPSLETV